MPICSNISQQNAMTSHSVNITTEYFLLQHCMRLLCSVIVSCSVPHYICIFLTLVSAYSPTLLTPLPQSIPYKSLPQAAISTNIIPHALPCSRKAKETAAYMGADLQGKQEGNGGREGGVGLNGEALSGRMGRGYSLGREPIQLQAVVQPWFLWRHKIHISTISSSLP